MGNSHTKNQSESQEYHIKRKKITLLFRESIQNLLIWTYNTGANPKAVPECRGRP